MSTDAIVLLSGDHKEIRGLCMELYTMEPDDERFDAKTTVLIESATHHIEEEQEWFPKGLKKALDAVRA